MDNLDPKNVLGSTENFADQCQQIWEQSKSLEFPHEFKNIQNIVVCGMGGSAYGGYVTPSLFKDSLNIPLVSNNDYHLPNFANEKTLVILLSYSGSTEEVLSCLDEAKNKGAKITGITTGGKLAEALEKDNLTFLTFNPKFNPSGQPRLGTGYMVLGFIALLNRIGLLNISDQEVKNAISEVKQELENTKIEAKSLAEKIRGFIPVVVTAEFLAGNAHILRNQFNETAKSFSSFSHLPELNHHLMEGLKNPPDEQSSSSSKQSFSSSKKLHFLFITSDLYSDKLKKRFKLTEDVVFRQEVGFSEYQAKGSSKISQMLNVLSFGGYISYYLAMLYKQDPSLIPWVDYFKNQLEKDS